MDKMYLIVTIRREVTDRDQGRLIYDLVKQKLQDRPDLALTGHVTNHYDLEEPT